mmetsp:Transcript_169903/g.545214  ORF Transcript_169903/g.545214 Transcript_169903/m.545214 type:complete len:182 (-) Transcript_169903:115-660(-)
MSHRHDPGSASQKVGNHVGNTMKGLLGSPYLARDASQKQGAHSGPVYDAAAHIVLPYHGGGVAGSSASPARSNSATMEVLNKGDAVMRNGKYCEVVAVDFATDPPSYTVRFPDGSEVGTEHSKLTLVGGEPPMPQTTPSQAHRAARSIGGSSLCNGFAPKRSTGPLSRRCLHCERHEDDHK